jgi:hypothetical protein
MTQLTTSDQLRSYQIGLIHHLFDCFPTSERPYTYVSSKSKSTIDYCFFRGVDVSTFHVEANAVAQHRPLVSEFVLPETAATPSATCLGTAYWRSNTKRQAFEAGVHSVHHVMDDATPYDLQSYYDKFMNLFALHKKRTTRKLLAESWECFLEEVDLCNLRNLRDEASSLSLACDISDQSQQQHLTDKKRALELLTTSLMRKSLDRETDKLSKVASSHVDAWKVLTTE